ncbi:magnesium transporter, partial [candidate division WWE3 bacterium]|nr:magnesium transporter [candidate division WWE3 bacterium]
INTPLKASVIHRLPWLILGLVGGIAAAKIVEVFEVTLSQNIILAAFIPLIVYMGDAVGTQMEAFIIRDLSLNPKLSILKYFSKQLMVVLSLGIISAIMVYLTTILIYGTSTIAAILSISMFFAILSSVITGLFVPYIFGKMNFDPANASGPIATILQDLMSVSIYFAAAHILLQM